ncbi:MAG: transglutaminase family protein [Archangium sp.]|nr:transglutaminase family protein [Archangium sp.]
MDFEKYLRPTAFIDSEHPAIAALAKEADASTEKERAIKLFLKVRDDVRYDPYSISLDPGAFAASTTLQNKRGFCVTKAILLTAGLRALHIPARLGFVDVINHLATERLRTLMRTDVFAFHGFAEAWLDGKWVKATPAFNASLCEKFGTEPLDFDGVHDAVLQPLNRSGARFMEYVRDRGTFDDFPQAAMLDAWKELYPHFFGAVPSSPEGDFEAEAARDAGSSPRTR